MLYNTFHCLPCTAGNTFHWLTHPRSHPQQRYHLHACLSSLCTPWGRRLQLSLASSIMQIPSRHSVNIYQWVNERTDGAGWKRASSRLKGNSECENTPQTVISSMWRVPFPSYQSPSFSPAPLFIYLFIYGEALRVKGLRIRKQIEKGMIKQQGWKTPASHNKIPKGKMIQAWKKAWILGQRTQLHHPARPLTSCATLDKPHSPWA